MKTVRLIVFSIVILSVFARASIESNVSRHRKEIERTLLSVRKKHVSCQQSIFKALDHVNKVCSLCTAQIKEKKELQKKLDEQQRQAEQFRFNNEQLKSENVTLRQQLNMSEKQTAQHLARLERTRFEKDKLASQAHDTAEKKRQYAQQLRMLERYQQQEQQEQSEQDDEEQSEQDEEEQPQVEIADYAVTGTQAA